MPPKAVAVLSEPNVQIATIDRAEIVYRPWSWDFARDRRDDIEDYFAKLQGERAGVWNGRVLLLNHYVIGDRALQGTCFGTDFASFAAWRSWNFPDASVANVFAAAALRAADGAYLVGEMAPYTAAAGWLYFPAGTPEPADIDANGALDLDGSLRRELKEETGLDTGEFDSEAGWTVAVDRCFVAFLKRLTAPQSADALRSRIMRDLARQQNPEFVDIRIVRGPDDLDARMPRFVVAFLEREWRR